MTVTVSVPITSRNYRHTDDGFEAAIIVSEFSEELRERTYGRQEKINAAATFLVNDYDDIPYRGDHVEVSVDVKTGEASIIWQREWNER